MCTKKKEENLGKVSLNISMANVHFFAHFYPLWDRAKYFKSIVTAA